jgi:hypothetical protein
VFWRVQASGGVPSMSVNRKVTILVGSSLMAWIVDLRCSEPSPDQARVVSWMRGKQSACVGFGKPRGRCPRCASRDIALVKVRRA